MALGSDQGNPTCPMDRLQSADFTPEQQAIKHPVLKRLMDPLNAIEQEIVWTRLYDGARTWADAATIVVAHPARAQRCAVSSSNSKTLSSSVVRHRNAAQLPPPRCPVPRTAEHPGL